MRHTNRVGLLPNRGWDPRILVFANPPLVQVFAAITTRYVVLLDTLINPATARAVLDHLAPHLTGRTLLVVNTHADYDHAWGNQLFAGNNAIAPAPVVAHRRCAAEFAHAPGLLAEFAAAEPDIFGEVRLTPPTLLFDGTLTLDGGDLTLELIPTPGHTPDHISVWIPQIATLLAGDAAELPFPFAAQPAELPTLRASLARLAGLPAATALYCHAPVSSGPKVIRDNLAYFDQLEEACRAALGRGVDVTAAADAELPGLIGYAYADAPAAHARQCRMMLEWLTAAA
jgi:glyoxylase-like metal-dependent hydrolase (beta-lactamase superfamily II)